MSKTYRGEKGSGYEYWSKRPNKDGGVGKRSKRTTHKTERQRNKPRREDYE